MWTILHTEASLGWGGQEIRILNESLGMKGRGHRVIIVAQDDSLLIKRARKAGLETIALSFRKKDYPRTVLAISRLLKGLDPDFIVTHSSRDSWLFSFTSWVSRHKAFVIRTRHISTPVAANFSSSILYRKLPDRIITTAEAIKEQLVERNGVDPKKVISIPTGIDTASFDPSRKLKDIRAELSLPEGTPLAGMISVLRSWKGHDYFIEAARLVSMRVPQARFIITGDGPRRDAIRAIIDEKGLSKTVLMIGHRDDVPDILATLDILVQPSYANEGVPQSVLQAMAMGVPVVASDLRPFREVVFESRTGFLVPARDPEALAERITLLFNDSALRAKLGRAARKIALERFSTGRMLDSTEKLYRELIRSRAGSGDEPAKGHSRGGIREAPTRRI